MAVGQRHSAAECVGWSGRFRGGEAPTHGAVRHMWHRWGTGGDDRAERGEQRDILRPATPSAMAAGDSPARLTQPTVYLADCGCSFVRFALGGQGQVTSGAPRRVSGGPKVIGGCLVCPAPGPQHLRRPPAAARRRRLGLVLRRSGNGHRVAGGGAVHGDHHANRRCRCPVRRPGGVRFGWRSVPGAVTVPRSADTCGVAVLLPNAGLARRVR